MLIVTDAAISDFAETKVEIQELSKRNVKIYIIFIDETTVTQDTEQPAKAPELLEEVVSRGGKFFPVSDEKALENAYAEIDRLEKITVTEERKVFTTPVFYKFIFVAIVFFIFLIPLGVSMELLSYP